MRELSSDATRGRTLYDFGAVGDGETDDAGALQEAVDSGETIIIPQASFLIGSRVTVSQQCSLVGLGWQSVLLGPASGTHILLLVQSDTFDAIDGIRFANFVVDGNGGGQLDAALVQFNNARAFLCDRLWVKNGSRTNGSQGVNGINASAGQLGGFGSSGVISNCLLENMSKGAINWTTQADGAAILSNIVRDITGNGSAPGIQLNGGFGAKVLANDVQNTEGPGIYVAAVGTVPPIDTEETIIALNRCNGCGASSATQADGILVANATATVTGRLILSANVVVDSGNATGGGDGIHVQNSINVDVLGNFTRNSRLNGIRIDGTSHVAVIGNRSTGNNTAGVSSGAGILLTGTIEHCAVLANHCSDDKAVRTQNYGVTLLSGASIDELTLRDNHLDGNNTGQLLADATVGKCDIAVAVSVQTTDATPATAQYLNLADPATHSVLARIVGQESGGGNRAIYAREAALYRAGAGAAQEGSTTTLGADIESDAAWGGPSFATGSNAYSLRVTGKAATTIDWRARIEVLGL